MRTRRWIVRRLEDACVWTHWITLHRPWLWVFPPCSLAAASDALDQRWGTGVWGPVE